MGEKKMRQYEVPVAVTVRVIVKAKNLDEAKEKIRGAVLVDLPDGVWLSKPLEEVRMWAGKWHKARRDCPKCGKYWLSQGMCPQCDEQAECTENVSPHFSGGRQCGHTVKAHLLKPGPKLAPGAWDYDRRDITPEIREATVIQSGPACIHCRKRNEGYVEEWLEWSK